MMRLLFLCATLGTALITYAQLGTPSGPYYQTDFETDWSRIKIDTANPTNIWQVGAPSKVYFDAAHSAPNAMTTDTLLTYPINNSSSFQFKINGTDGTMGPSMWAYSLEFWHKLNTPLDMDGGFVEVSYDSINWYNIVLDTVPNYMCWFSTSNFYTTNDTLQDGTPAFSGTQDWTYVMVQWIPVCPVFQGGSERSSGGFPLIDSVYFRFTFQSDGTLETSDGWMIDDLSVMEWYISGVPEYTLNDAVHTYPNPASEVLYVHCASEAFKPRSLRVVDLSGRLLMEQPYILNTTNSVDVRALDPGNYWVMLVDADGQTASKPIVVN